jgi:hypothetical protein
MFKIHGTEFRYQDQLLVESTIILVHDHHYDEHQQQFHVKKLLENSRCDPGSHVIIFDHVVQHDDVLKNYNLVFFPSFMSRECCEFQQQKIITDWNNKTKIFNFMINKPRPHRKLLLRMIREYDLVNFTHSLAWRSNPVNDIAVTEYRLGPEVVMDLGVRNGSIRNARTYQELLQKNVFEPSCISLITEPVFHERETIVTEKTIMSMYAGTFPIWVGGWRIPDYLTSVGFDVFADIIDHSYQDLPDPETRCRRALELNLNLLKDLDTVKSLNQQCHSRFETNMRLIQQNRFRALCLEQIEHAQGKLKQVLGDMLGLTTHK